MDKAYLMKILSNSFKKGFQIEEKKENLFQLFAPLYHPDGDMMDIFIKVNPSNPKYLTVCDCGLTLMRLSYDFDIDTPNKQNILNNIISENGAVFDNGDISITSKSEFLFMNILQMTQISAKIMNMRTLQRDIVTSLFFEQLNDHIHTKLKDFHPETGFAPLQGREDLTVDYLFKTNKGKPVYLFAVNNNDKAKTATISMLFFQRENLHFTGAVVHENYDALSANVRKSIMSASDKQFYDLSDFEKNSSEFLNRAFYN